MSWGHGILLAIAVVGAGLLAGCLPSGHGENVRARGEAISISRGPCFGFCPVYEVAISPGGSVDFEGKRHTAVLGTRSQTVGRTAYQKVRRSLAPLRPATGRDQEFPCLAQPTDMSLFTIEWMSAHGTRTVLRYRMGCRDEAATAVERLIEEQLQTLGVNEWAEQRTWPGVGRGERPAPAPLR